MSRIRHYATICLLLLGIGGCTPEPTTSLQTQQDDLQDLSTWDFGDEHLDSTVRPTDVLGIQSLSNDEQAVYAIAVGTFSGPGHFQSARQALGILSKQFPNVARNVTVRERSRGSVLAFGSYAGYDDQNAKRDVETLKRIVDQQGKPLFGQILVCKFRKPLSKRRLHPHDLWSVRKEFPTIVPIYTLEVAIWGDFGGGQFPTAKRRAAAEQFANEIRSKGFEAFFYHNDDRDLSSVTVGLFSYLAVDASTGFYSAEVEAMIARFPERLVNGQQVLEYLDPLNPGFGTRVQPPCLVEVPVD